MAYVFRRVFFAKVGQADQVVDVFKRFDGIVSKHGLKSRILTDFQSGRSDRVIVEWQVDQITDMEKAMEAMMENPEESKQFQDWEREMNGFIHYSEAEVLQVQR